MWSTMPAARQRSSSARHDVGAHGDDRHLAVGAVGWPGWRGWRPGRPCRACARPSGSRRSGQATGRLHRLLARAASRPRSRAGPAGSRPARGSSDGRRPAGRAPLQSAEPRPSAAHGRSRPVATLGGQLEPEGRALPGPALDADPPAHQLDQALADGQAQARAAVLAGGRAVGLGEALEQAADRLGLDADAGVASPRSAGSRRRRHRRRVSSDVALAR